MGLSISGPIIEDHGGLLWAENNSDRGATFYLRCRWGTGRGEGRGAVKSRKCAHIQVSGFGCRVSVKLV